MIPLRYSDDIETLEPDEQKTIDGIIEGMTKESQTVEKRDGHAVRASHAKSTACVVGELIVASNLPPELAQGLFARPGTYQVAVRFAQGPGENLNDRVSTHRGMAIKVFGVGDEKLPDHESPTQDFVFASGPTFPAGTATGFLSQAKKIGLTVAMPESVKSAASSLAHGMNTVLNAVGAGPSPTLDFYGHPSGHPLKETYYSQCPMRFGDHVAKLGAFPSSSRQDALAEWRLDADGNEDGFRHAAVDYFTTSDAIFELRAQLWTDAETQPIEDTSIDWPVADSPYQTIATLRLPRQAAYGHERVRYFDEVMTFRPAHSLAAHRPLGGVMRARLQVYRALSRFRHRETGVAEQNTSAVDQIPH